MKPRIEPEKTVLTITVGFMVIYLFTDLDLFLYISSAVGIMGVFSPWLSAKIDYLWSKLTWLLSMIIPNVLLSIVYFLVLFPISLLAKIFGKGDTLQLKNPGTSNFKNVDKSFDPSTFEKIW